MTLKVAINGFGRIGRLVLRAIAEQKRQDLQIVAINDLADIEDNAYLLRYDSVHGPAPFPIKTSGKILDAGLGPIQVLAEPHPEKLPWRELNIDLVMECSGRFTSRETAAKHLTAGAKRVLISAPADDVDHTVVFGVNHQTLTRDHIVVSNASCTTNCLAPVAFVLHKALGIDHGYMTTIHAYTGDQRLVDTFHKDPRRARSAALSMIPTSTGAARAVGLVLPELKGKLDGTAIRVPTPNVSLIDFKFVAKKSTTREEINDAIQKAEANELKGVLGTVNEPLVSCDFNHNPLSSVFDLSQTQVIEGRFCRILSWYDNEWGFSNRMSDTALIMGKFL
ncbi:glyceraldehyde-3-phosphate dehydrogenase [Caedimonas varicaedens]|jgi:glyceraldehyde 3-phosphate dehydrogenase|uniref:Glyceraldehyde-3-phosphate dehydrogenase n=1 Tax=Caedimonas varicaedens TaxID=1629334 RepID=A0A0K8MAR7_9PROT|nr:glyceraldehyde-3-phosphate dehydrogenase [Caedimonas varicaedens]